MLKNKRKKYEAPCMEIVDVELTTCLIVPSPNASLGGGTLPLNDNDNDLDFDDISNVSFK